MELVAFPEAFLSGYPFWLDVTGGARFDDPLQKQAYAAYLQAAVAMDGPEVRQVVEAARDLGVFVYLGTTERATGLARGTVFCTLVAVDPTSGVLGTHRKLMPTARNAWSGAPATGTGCGSTATAPRAWAGSTAGRTGCPRPGTPCTRRARSCTSASGRATRNTVDITRFIALEGRMFSLAANGLLSLADVPTGFPLYEELKALDVQDYCRGGSAVAGPDGRWLVEPVEGEERLVVADLELGQVAQERQNFDPTGHYSRPDVFTVQVDRRRQEAAEFVD